MLDKKEKEQIALETYLNNSNPKFEIIQHESPDFILKQGNKRIGCEVTEFYRDYSSKGSTSRKREIFLNKLHKELRRILKNTFPIGYSFIIQDEQNSLNKSVTESESLIVVEKVKENINLRSIKKPSENVRRIVIKRINNLTTRVILFIATDYKASKFKWLDPIISNKSNLLAKWKNKYDENWLIISVGLSRSSDLEINKIDFNYKISFDQWNKIILEDVPFEEFVELNAT